MNGLSNSGKKAIYPELMTVAREMRANPTKTATINNFYKISPRYGGLGAYQLDKTPKLTEVIGRMNLNNIHA